MLKVLICLPLNIDYPSFEKGGEEVSYTIPRGTQISYTIPRGTQISYTIPRGTQITLHDTTRNSNYVTIPNKMSYTHRMKRCRRSFSCTSSYDEPIRD